MSMSVNVYALRPVTDDYRKRLAIYQSCNELGIHPPKELLEYFDYMEHPCKDGILVELSDDLINHDTDMYRCSNYYDVDLTKLPKGVTKVRFEISY